MPLNEGASRPGELTVRSGRVKHVRRLATRAFRAETGEFIAEGPQAVREALDSDATLEIFATVHATDQFRDLQAIAEAAGVTWHVVSDDIVEAVADSVTPQGLVARCASMIGSLDDLASDVTFVIVCAEMRDPGNAGAVIRCADAAGVDAVILSGDSVDPTNPKAVRATAGSLFHLPVLAHRDHGEVISLLRDRGIQVLAADGRGDVNLFEPALDLTRPTAWVMGNEAKGLSPDQRELADLVVSVPIYGRAESLNLATAAAVCLYATAQART